MPTDGSAAPQGIDLGYVYYVISGPQQDPARVVAGPMDDADNAKRRANFELGIAEPMLGIRLVHNIQDNGYNVEWDDNVDRPQVLVEEGDDAE